MSESTSGRGRKKTGPTNTEQELELLRRAILAVKAENEALRTANRLSGSAERVILRNTGLCQVVIPIDGEPDLVLDPRGTRTVGSIPAHVYARLKRDSKIFEVGTVVVEGEPPIGNPNVIPDIPSWIAAKSEKQITEAVEQITAEGTFHMLWNYCESLAEPIGKHFVMKKAITKRVRELFGYSLIDEE
jgi:hypothetical protein